MEAPLISIVIPVYNHEEALERALRSIAGQTYRPIEVIIVDDGSMPQIKNQKSKFKNQIPLTLIFQKHMGAPAARNRGLREVKGEYVIFWDADVVAEPEMLERMRRALETHPDASYAYCDFYFGRKKMSARVFDAQALRERNYIHSTSLVRKSDVIWWDESLARFQDWDMWLTMLEQGKRGVYIPEYLFMVLPHRGGISAWLPSFSYRPPWRLLPGIRKRVRAYETARDAIRRKHAL